MRSEGSRGELSLPQERIIYGFDVAAGELAGGTLRGSAQAHHLIPLDAGLLLFPGEADAQQQDCANKPAINNRKGRCPRSRCGLNNNCRCATTVRNKKTCVNFRNASCPTRNECNSTRDCARGRVCVLVGGCCGRKNRHLCAPKC